MADQPLANKAHIGKQLRDLRATRELSLRHLRVERIPIGEDRVDVDVVDGAVRVSGLGPDVELVQSPRRPLTAALPGRR